MDALTKGLLLGFALVMFANIAAILVRRLTASGSAISHLDRTIELPLEAGEVEARKELIGQRLAALGFSPANEPGNFIQGGRDMGEMVSASHARTRKLLNLAYTTSAAGQVVVSITLRYLGLIVVDTGESAYRDAVLDFISGKSKEMVIIPNESLMAVNSLVGGIFACATALVLILTNQLGLWSSLLVLGITEFATGLIALFSISQKPVEITGRGKAIAGMLLSIAAICIGLYFLLATRSSPRA